MKITRKQLRSLILEAAHDLDDEEFEEEEEETESQEQKIAKLMSSGADGYAQAKELLQALDIDFADYVRKNSIVRQAVIENEIGTDQDLSNVNLVNVMAALKKSSFFVGNNAGPLNISAAMNIDSYGLISNDPISELKYSNIIAITPDNYKDNVWYRNREGMKNLTVEKVYNFIISHIKNKKL